VALIMFLQLSTYASRPGVAQETELHLMPVPQRVARDKGEFRIDNTFTVHMTGYPDPRLPAAAARFLHRLQKITGIPLAMSPAQQASEQTALEIRCNGAGEQIQSPRADESYTLEVSIRGARLTAPSPLGILRGLETFLQLVDLDGRSFFVPSVKIEDRPRFPWRGLLIDVSRHFEPVEVILRNLDAMAAMKMNVLHWHLSDDQGFRVESRIFPKLHKLGSEGQYYTQEEVREIVGYARDRGIRVVPEFDMPGHTTSWLVAYPELASAPGPYQIERSWGVFDPCMDPTRKKTYSFLDSFIGEMAGLFPDEYFHIGGDEVSGKQWNASPAIRSFKRRRHLKDNRDLQAYFNQRLLKILAKHGKKMIGWDEILHPDLPKSITVQSWRRQDSVADSARRGYAGILSYGYYLDHMRPAVFHYEMDPLGKQAASLTEGEQTRILGGEACMWGEFVNPDNIESRIWPRTAAIAERLWSPPGLRDVHDMYRRLEYANRELDSLGLMHRVKYLEMLQRMSGEGSVAPLKTLADLLNPTGLGVRLRSRKYSSLTPLNRMVDTVLPESDTARMFGDLVDNALADQPMPAGVFQEIRRLLICWQENENLVKPMTEQSFLLSEIGPLAKAVFELSVKGLEALDYIGLRQKPPETWSTEAALLLQESEKPQAEMLIAIVPSIKKLIDAANNIK
jgi:hexosaminidase